MSNHLLNETSPYLLQHASNPVEWYPWGDEALSAARSQEKPILLSIGYAACHWCHVMAHESFEDKETAAYMNQHFINIKVDREERPDLDNIYMGAVQAMTGQGGWPLTVVLTPEGVPFFGGTYFPRHQGHGLASFRQVLSSIVHAWQHRREEIETTVEQLAQHLNRALVMAGRPELLTHHLLDDAVRTLANSFDNERGGFGGAPKFPPSMTIEFLLRYYLRTGDKQVLFMVEQTLEKMACGGIYDQIGGGFARYATDASWLVPHFEKMLYDNALLSRIYLHAWQVTGKPLFKRVVEETLDFVIRELRHEGGGFYSSFDADSEGEEGKFYVWRPVEIRDVLGSDADLFMLYYDVSERGNWEGRNILNVPRDLAEVSSIANIEPADLAAKLAIGRKRLYETRSHRAWPGLDDKVLTSWNGLMLASFAEAGHLLDRPDYTEAAKSNARFLSANLRTADGRLRRTWKPGSGAKYNAYLEDYAFLADGLLALYQNTFDEQWINWARELADMFLTHFSDEEHGGFYDTSNDHEQLFQRPKDVQDNATPSGNSMAAHVLLRLSLYTGNMTYWDMAQRVTSSLYQVMVQYPTAFAQWLSAAEFILGEPQEVAIIGGSDQQETQKLLAAVKTGYRPNLVVAVGQDDGLPLLANRDKQDGRATAYVCRRFVCKSPVTDPAALRQLLDGNPRG